MTKLRVLAIVLLLLPASTLIASESVTDCLRNCRPGVNSCSDCCLAQDNDINGAKISACRNKCFDAFTACANKCREKNEQAVRACQAAFKCEEKKTDFEKHNCMRNNYPSCAGKTVEGCSVSSGGRGERGGGSTYPMCSGPHNDCNQKCEELRSPIPGKCPGEVQPQKCPFNCQMWNPASQSCVGAPMNRC